MPRIVQEASCLRSSSTMKAGDLVGRNRADPQAAELGQEVLAKHGRVVVECSLAPLPCPVDLALEVGEPALGNLTEGELRTADEDARSRCLEQSCRSRRASSTVFASTTRKRGRPSIER